MELLVTSANYFLVKENSVLQCDRKTAKLICVPSTALPNDAVCIGCFDGFIGKVAGSASGQCPPHLLLVTRARPVGQHPFTGQQMLAVDQVQAVPVSLQLGLQTQNLNLTACPKHSSENSKITNSGMDFLQKGSRKFLKGTTNSIQKFGDQVSNPLNRMGIKSPLSSAAKPFVPSEKVGPAVQDTAGQSLDELLRLFNETTNFYYCPNTDLTLNMQTLIKGFGENTNKMEKTSDERFIWNKHLLSDCPNESLWCTPLIQGFVQQREVALDPSLAMQHHKCLTLTLISRRSVFRAGTRYMRRGIDEQGHCANFVETEQILNVFGHCVSFLVIRGSIPLFWNQSGLKYHPMPRFERSRTENIESLMKHLDGLKQLYGEPVAVVNLVDQTGRELPLAESFLDYVVELNSNWMHYFSFDFHDHCKGLRLDRVDVLVRALDNDMKDMKFTWVDKALNVICKQKGAMRINCVDCLDRTNVVQMGVGRAALELQLMKLGLLPPDQSLPPDLVGLLQLIWADNGDAVSKQYAGTAALKGDFTRSGQRNIYGLVKDGYNSASRYYLNHIRDASRQAAIDFLLGYKTDTTNPVVAVQEKDKTDVDYDEKIHEELRLLVQECQRFFLPEEETLLAAWALIDTDLVTGGDLSVSDMDRTVLLTRAQLFVADYDSDLDKFTDCTSIPLHNITRIEVGPLALPSSFPNAFKAMSKNKSSNGPTCLRIHYTPTQLGVQQNGNGLVKNAGCSAYFYTWRAGDTRLFNNVAIPLRTQEEADEYVHAIAEQFYVAMQVAGISSLSKIDHVSKMERKKSRNSCITECGTGRFTGLFTGFSRKLVAGTANLNPLKLRSPQASLTEPIDNDITRSLVAPVHASNSFISVDHMHLHQIGIIFSTEKEFPCALAEDVRKSRSLSDLVGQAGAIDQKDQKPANLPLFVLPTDEESPTSGLKQENTQSNTCLHRVNDNKEEQLLSAHLQMRTCQSEGLIKDMLIDKGAEEKTSDSMKRNDSKNNIKLMGRLASGGGKLLGMTSLSFSKLSTQVHNLRSPKEPQIPKKFQARANIFQAYRDRIMNSQTKITLL